MYVCIHTHEYDPVIKNNEMKPFAATWMNLGIIILGEVGEKQI